MQTALVLLRNRHVAGLLGPSRALAVALTLVNLVIGPLLTPVALGLLVFHIRDSALMSPNGPFSIAEATLVMSVALLGVGSTLWTGYVAARVRHIPLTCLPAMLPYVLLVGAAAWVGLLDLIRRPYHWHKTDHGDSASHRRRKPEARRLSNTPIGLVPAFRRFDAVATVPIP